MKSHAFTLVELLIVISIIALLASFMLVGLRTAREKARITSAKEFAQRIHNAIGSEAVGVWGFNEGSGTTATDSSGLSNNGTLTGGVVWQDEATCGLDTGSCLDFDGSTGYVAVPNDSTLELRTGVTASVWTRQEGAIDSATQRTLVGKDGEFHLHVSYGRPRFTINAETDPGGCNPGYCQAHGGPILSPGRWYHLAGTFDGQKIKVYLDGVLRDERDWVTNIADSANSPRIGGNIWGYTLGLIDEPRIYSKALSQAQIQKLYAEGAKRHKIIEN